ncbi:hypothetical protein B484DRAFT_446685 [Ochromonadaceae sp. CCMP2298]|nr:hypothetical protein B484DRAFT_446685 [Ochromonadaceae sp. CCMP2298]|mmetsp:Transcript_14158/g.31260  ORF Transcript_14158/g.31260 Transcript_14158/m.31260 type:complete len:467 (+) Transcript_14158:117-1517(+)
MAYNADTSDMKQYSEIYKDPPLEKGAAKSKLVIALQIFRSSSAEQSVAVLDTILCCLFSIQYSGHSTNIAGADVDACIRKLADILEHDLKARAGTTAWRIMAMLVDHQVNSSASAYNLLSAISADEALHSRLHRAAAKHLLLSTQFATYFPVVDSCLSYLGAFSSADGPRQIILGQTPDLIKYIVAASATFKSHAISQGIFTTLTNLLGRCVQTDTRNAVEFFKVGGFAVVQKACLGHVQIFLEVVLTSRNRECEELKTLAYVFAVLRAMCDIYPRMKSDLPLPGGPMDCDVVLALAEHLHKALSRSQYPELVKPVVLCVIGAVDFLRARPEHPAVILATVDRFLLNVNASDCIMVWMVRWSKSPTFSDCAQFLGQFLGECAQFSPRFRAAVEGELRSDNSRTASAHRGDNYRHCNYPSCMVSSDTTMSGASSLKRCVQCEVVSYCGREHQKADWKAHKKNCVKRS